MAVYAVATLDELLAKVREYLDEGTADEEVRPDPMLTAMLQDADFRYWELLASTLELRDASTTTFTTTQNTKTYALATVATDMWDAGFIYLHELDSNGFVADEWFKINPNQEDSENGFFLRGTNLVMSVAGGQVPGGISLRTSFIPLPSKMTTGSDTCNLPPGKERVIVMDVVKNALTAVDDKTGARTRYAAEHEELVKEFKYYIDSRVPLGSDIPDRRYDQTQGFEYI